MKPRYVNFYVLLLFFYMAGAGETVNFSVARMEDIQLNLHLNRHMSRMFRPQPIMGWKDKF